MDVSSSNLLRLLGKPSGNQTGISALILRRGWFVILLMMACPNLNAHAVDLECDDFCDSCSTCETHDPWESLPAMLGDAGLGVPRVFGTATRSVFFQDHFSKVSRNNSAEVANRFYSDNAILSDVAALRTNDGADDRDLDYRTYRFGLEKVLIEDGLSAELIIPFQNTSSSQFDDANLSDLRDYEMGNVALGLKACLLRTDNLLLSSGLRIELPTREDLVGETANVVIERDTWFFQPYVASALRRDDWFLQSFAGLRLRDSDNDGFLAGIPLPAFEFIDRDLFFFDIGVSRSFDVCCSELISTVTPTVELHYTQTIEGGDPLLFTEALYGSNVNRLNLTTGFTTQFAGGYSVGFGVVAALRDNTTVASAPIAGMSIDTDRAADAQVTWHLTRRF